jgi:hypothetical protein
MKNSGKIVIVTIVAVALGAAAFAAWYQYRGQKNALGFWGTTSAVLIAEAPQISIFELGEAGPSEQDQDESEPAEAEGAESAHPKSLEYADRAWKVLSAKAGHEAPGIKNIRRALVQDTTFDWKSDGKTSPSDVEPEWQYAIAFTDNRNWATVLFDFETGRVALTGGKKSAPLDPAASKDLREFFAEQFAGSAPADHPAEPPAEQESPPTDKPDEQVPAEPAPAP